MKFSGLEISAVTSLALLASGIDGDYDESEIAVIFVHLAAFDVPENERDKIIELSFKIPFEDAAKIVSCMTHEKKRHFAAFIGSIIIADGKITKSELDYWQKLSSATGLPTMTIQEAAKIFASNMGVKSNPSRSNNSSNSNNSGSNSDGSSPWGCLVLIAIGVIIYFITR